MFRRLRHHVHGTLSRADAAINSSTQLAAAIAADVAELIEESQDGIEFELITKPGHSIMDWLSGKTDALPFTVRMTIKE